MSGRPRYALEGVNISKRFGHLRALEGVSLRLRRGSFHALLGENGAGKSTLVKCIMGYHRPSEGQFLIDEQEQSIDNPHEAHRLGIGMVYQHFTLIPNMSVAENLVLARPCLPARIDWRAETRRLREKLDALPFQVPLDAAINSLSAGEKQKVEILKQLTLDCRILILDEPTSVLTPDEADEVLGRIKAMTRETDLSVLIITHKFREVMHYADEVTVLRKGRAAGTTTVAGTTPAALAGMMLGCDPKRMPSTRREVAVREQVLDLERLTVLDDNGEPAVRGLSLSVAGGEIVGIAGVSGNGQRELVQALCGQRDIGAGCMRVQAERFRATREEIRRHHFRCLPEEPLRNACVPGMTIAENLALREFDRAPYARCGGWLNRAAIGARAAALIERFSVSPPVPAMPIGQLSGGNVQRAVLARELSGDVSVLIVANPCFGLDFAAVAEVRERIMSARNQGAAVLLVSEDLEEILELADRLLVMAGGRLVYETTPAAADLTLIGQHMAGH